VFPGTPSRSVRPATGFGEKTELVVALDQRLYLPAGGGRQLLEGDLADDLMANCALGERRCRDGDHRQKDCALDGSQHGASRRESLAFMPIQFRLGKLLRSGRSAMTATTFADCYPAKRRSRTNSADRMWYLRAEARQFSPRTEMM
jgi:hypothetical protein